MLSRWPLSRLPEALAVVWVAALVGFVIRPYVQTVHSDASRSTAAYVGALQRALDLPPDPSRLYSEHSLYWVIWYIGLPTVLLAAFGLAIVVRRCLRWLARGAKWAAGYNYPPARRFSSTRPDWKCPNCSSARRSGGKRASST